MLLRVVWRPRNNATGPALHPQSIQAAVESHPQQQSGGHGVIAAALRYNLLPRTQEIKIKAPSQSRYKGACATAFVVCTPPRSPFLPKATCTLPGPRRTLSRNTTGCAPVCGLFCRHFFFGVCVFLALQEAADIGGCGCGWVWTWVWDARGMCVWSRRRAQQATGKLTGRKCRGPWRSTDQG